MSEYKLTQEILSRSVSNDWNLAKLEWSLETIWEEDEPDTCLCGHYPIKEICLLRNIKNNKAAKIGNVCVKKFLGLSSDKLFQNLKRIRKDNTKAINPETTEYAYKKSWINEWEFHFSISNFRKRNLSKKQMNIRAQINKKILAAFSQKTRK